ncbi:hypothetical protein [Bacillus pinisoli]|nr:hypothetical protein [Bacillus pinisoli]
MATLEGINDAFFVTVFIAAVALVMAFFIKRATPAEDSLIDTKQPKLAEN